MHQGLAPAIGQKARNQDGAVVGTAQLGNHQDGGGMPAELGANAIDEPLHHGAIGPEQLVLGPGIFFFAGIVQGALHPLWVSGEQHHPVIGTNLSRQLLEAAFQVIGPVKLDELLLSVDLSLQVRSLFQSGEPLGEEVEVRAI